MHFADALKNWSSIMHDATYKRTDFLSLFEQRFVSGQDKKDVLHDDRYWKRFVPNENSGPCETYDPPFESDPGYAISMFIRFKSGDWDPNLEIILHEKDNFFYSTSPTYMMVYLDSKRLRATNLSHPRAVGNLYTYPICLISV